MVHLRFEKLPSPIYPGYLHIGDYSIALEPELIQSLKQAVQEEPARFLDLLTQKIGSNRYLKEMVQEGISKSEEPDVLVKRLEEELRAM